MRLGIREIIFFIVLLAVPAASFVYVFKPRGDEIQEAKNEIEVKQARLDKLEAMTSQIDDIGLAIERGRESIRDVELKLPSRQMVEDILDGVWQLAKGNSLEVKSIKTEPEVPAAAYMELPLRMVLEGQFDGFYQFLLELENLPRITRLHQLQIDRISASSNPHYEGMRPGSMKAEFTLSIYFEDKSKTPTESSP
jgi:type IV pilus assembly protein PilO